MSFINTSLFAGAIILLVFGILATRYQSSVSEKLNLDSMIETLSTIGIHLNQGITKDDLLYSFSEQSYAKDFPSLLLSQYGAEVEHEPWGVRISDQVWYFDAEYIYGDGDYADIVTHMARIAGVSDQLHDVTDSVNFETSTATLSYRLGSQTYVFSPKVDNDWVDSNVVLEIAISIENHASSNRKFWYVDNGQASVLMVLSNEEAKRLNRLQKKHCYAV